MLFSAKDFVPVAAALALFPLNVGATAVASRASVCNGYSELCDKSYGNVTFVGAHDSYAVGTNNLATNQDYDITQQLTDGGLFNGGTLQDYLTKVKSWMDSNPNEVVTLLIVNIDDLPASEYAPVFVAAGVDKISYQPGTASMAASSWPTLGSMIDNGTRLVTFLDNSADISSVPYLIDEFTNVWETAYDLTDKNAFDCNVNRTKGDTSTQMYLINHFLDQVILGQPAPDPSEANTTNAASGTGSLGAQVSTCEASMGRAPNFMLLDFYEYAGTAPFEVAATANNVTFKSQSIATPKTSSSSSSSSSSSNYALPTSESNGLLRFASIMVTAVGLMFGGACAVF